jgi:hypothetical protein
MDRILIFLAFQAVASEESTAGVLLLPETFSEPPTPSNEAAPADRLNHSSSLPSKPVS